MKNLFLSKQFFFMSLMSGLFFIAAYGKNAENVFTAIYKTNAWGHAQSVSGPGSSLEETKVIRKELPFILKKYNIESISDAPCGDFFWMKEVDLHKFKYTGFDIVAALIEDNKKKFETNKIKFAKANIITDVLPKSDVIICRDALVHLPTSDITETLRNFKKSNSKYILITHYPNTKVNEEIAYMGNWRSLNFTIAPFNFPKPLIIIKEDPDNRVGVLRDKSLALWRLSDINI